VEPRAVRHEHLRVAVSAQSRCKQTSVVRNIFEQDHREGGAFQKRLRKFAHLTQSKLQFPKVPGRTATSIVLLTVLLAGLTPTGICALMCERHTRAESQRHCSQPSDSMPGMAHDHAAINHPVVVEAMTAVTMSQSCQTNCVTAERLNVWRKIVPQVKVVRSSAEVLSTTAEFLAPDFTAVWGLDSGPPAPPTAHGASFSILRI